MSRSLSLVLAVVLSAAGSSLAYSQDTQPAASTDAYPPAGQDVSSLKTENAALKKEVNDAAKTIAQLQSQIADDKKQLDAANAAVSNANAQLATANAQLAAAKAQPAPASAETTTTAADTSANPAAPSGPLKALPLDATNVVTTPGAPGSPAVDTTGSRTYTVVKGDSLWKIAHKMYPHDIKNGVDKIQEANKDAIGNKPLKIGQVLIIPQ